MKNNQNNNELNNEGLENTIALALVTFFYKEGLLTESEFAIIKNKLPTGNINVAISQNKCDVYM